MSAESMSDDTGREARAFNELHWTKPRRGVSWQVSERQFAFLDGASALLRFIQLNAARDHVPKLQQELDEAKSAASISLKAWQTRNPENLTEFYAETSLFTALSAAFDGLSALAYNQAWIANSPGDVNRALHDPQVPNLFITTMVAPSTLTEAQILRGLSVQHLPIGSFVLQQAARPIGAFVLYVKDALNTSIKVRQLLVPVDKSTAWRGPSAIDARESDPMRTYASLYALGNALGLVWQSDAPLNSDNWRRANINQTIAVVLDYAKQQPMPNLLANLESREEGEVIQLTMNLAERLRDVVRGMVRGPASADGARRVSMLINWSINMALLFVLLGDHNYHPTRQLSSLVLEQSVAICDEFRAPPPPLAPAPRS